MAVKSLVDDYLLAAMKRLEVTHVDNGGIVLTIREFPGLIGCGQDAGEAWGELYRRLENLVTRSVERGASLPVLWLNDAEINLNATESHARSDYHHSSQAVLSEQKGTRIDSQEDLERFFDEMPEQS